MAEKNNIILPESYDSKSGIQLEQTRQEIMFPVDIIER